MDRQIQALLNHQVTYEPFLEYSGRGVPVFGNGMTSTCYITSDVKVVRSMNGEEVASSLTIFFSGTDAARIGLVVDGVSGILGTVNPEAHMGRITLPNGRQPPMISVLPYYDFNGRLDYVEVHI